MAQMSKWKGLLLGGGAFFMSAVGIVKVNEGYSTEAYYDSAKVLTICYGETKGVRHGEVRTKAQCDRQLKESLLAHAQVLDNVPNKTPDVVALGALDMAYNVGVKGFNNSEAKRWILAGNYEKAGQAVLKWRYITINGKKFDCSVKGNKKCWGLWKRRLVEADMIGNKISVQEAMRRLGAL